MTKFPIPKIQSIKCGMIFTPTHIYIHAHTNKHTLHFKTIHSNQFMHHSLCSYFPNCFLWLWCIVNGYGWCIISTIDFSRNDDLLCLSIHFAIVHHNKRKKIFLYRTFSEFLPLIHPSKYRHL